MKTIELFSKKNKFKKDVEALILSNKNLIAAYDKLLVKNIGSLKGSDIDIIRKNKAELLDHSQNLEKIK